jgi:enamine deaminase RidA (YjgF/YER057c/UK114 family)
MLKRNYFPINTKKSFREEIILCAKILQEKYQSDTIIGITLFLNVSDNEDFIDKKKQINTLFDEQFKNLPVSIIAQSSTDRIAVEIWTHNSCRNLIHKQLCGVNYTLYEDERGKSLWAFGASTNDPTFSFREQAYHAFEAIQVVLSTEGFTMDNLVRQWNYIPGILQTTTEYNRLYQNYQLFNDIRQYYYGIYKRNNNYPAATGIGMDCGVVTIDFLAIRENDATAVTGLNNPNQTDAYKYGQQVLVGSPLKENETKKTPLFERAKYIGNSEKGLVFVSGTASIIGEKTIGADDVTKQTAITIHNISDLLSSSNLEAAGISAQKGNYDYLRVYIKNEKDQDFVMKICKEQYGNIPILYVKADICRNDLLVEIEGEVSFAC